MSAAALKAIVTGTAVAPTGPKTFTQLLDGMKGQLAAALPKHITPDRMARVALTCYRNTPKLAECTTQSVLSAVVQCAQLGLEPGLLGQAYLVPFKRKWKEGNQWREQMECQFIPGYRGLISLARRSGDVTSINAEVVYDADEFDLTLGVDPRIVHRPKLDGDSGRPRLCYAVATFRTGGTQFAWITLAQVEAIRARSKAGDNGPWQTDYDEMVKKTVIRRLCKYLPMSVEMAVAVAAVDAAEAGRGFKVTGTGEDAVIDVDGGPVPELGEADPYAEIKALIDKAAAPEDFQEISARLEHQAQHGPLPMPAIEELSGLAKARLDAVPKG